MDDAQRQLYRSLTIESPPDASAPSGGALSQLLLSRLTEGSGSGDVTVTEQETLLTALRARITEDMLIAPELILNMPEGSELRSCLVADEIKIVKSIEPIQLEAVAGTLQLLDHAGIERISIQAVGPDVYEVKPRLDKTADGKYLEIRLDVVPPKPRLHITATEEHGEIVLRIRAVQSGGEAGDVQAKLDLKPVAAADEKESRRGKVRYQLQRGKANEEDPTRVKIQWLRALKQRYHTEERLDPTKLEERR